MSIFLLIGSEISIENDRSTTVIEETYSTKFDNILHNTTSTEMPTFKIFDEPRYSFSNVLYDGDGYSMESSNHVRISKGPFDLILEDDKPKNQNSTIKNKNKNRGSRKRKPKSKKIIGRLSTSSTTHTSKNDRFELENKQIISQTKDSIQEKCKDVACESPCYIFRINLEDCPECSCPDAKWDRIKFIATSSFEPSRIIDRSRIRHLNRKP